MSKITTITDARKNISNNADSNGIDLITKDGEPTAIIINFGELPEEEKRSLKHTYAFNKFGAVKKALENL